MKKREAFILIVVLLLTAFAAGTLTAQDAVSSASPGREPIWTARLLFIAINNGVYEDARAMFDMEAEIVYFGSSVPGDEIASWLREEIFDPKVRIKVKDQNIDGEIVTVILEWNDPGGPIQLRRFVFTQDDQGLIGKLVIDGAE